MATGIVNHYNVQPVYDVFVNTDRRDLGRVHVHDVRLDRLHVGARDGADRVGDVLRRRVIFGDPLAVMIDGVECA